MPPYEIYSARKRREEEGDPDVYTYNELPHTLRVQIKHIWDSALGPEFHPGPAWMGSAPNHNTAMWNKIRDMVCREQGKISLASCSEPKRDCEFFLLDHNITSEVLDVIEVSFMFISNILSNMRKIDREKLGVTQLPLDAIEELNRRFRTAAVGYQFEEGRIVKVESEFTHSELIRPVLRLLSNPEFAGPDEEFRRAHEHFRSGNEKEAVVHANNAFESTLKTICELKGWEYEKGARASDLLKVARRNGLLPDYLDSSFDQLAATLASGLPKVRENAGAHGQGGKPRKTPAYVAGYAINLCAANILLFLQALKNSSEQTEIDQTHD